MSEESDKCKNNLPPTPEEQASTMADLAKSIGANEKCSKMASDLNTTISKSASEASTTARSTATTDATTFATTSAVSAGYSAEAGWGAASVSGSVSAGTSTAGSSATSSASSQSGSQNKASQDFYNAAGRTMAEAGCGAIAINSSKISQAKNTIQCTIQKSMVESSASVVANASVNIQSAQMTKEQTEAMINAVDKAYKFASLVANNPRYSPDDVLKFIEASTNMFDFSIDLENADISQKVTGTIKTSCVLSQASQQTVSNAQNAIANAVAETAITAAQGTSALDPNTKSLIQNDQSIKDNTSTSSINEKVNSVKSNVSASGNINIISGGKINLKNVKINQDIVASIISDMLVNDAISTGLQAAGSIATSSQTSQTTSTESSGTEALVQAGGTAGAGVIAASGTAGAGAGTASGTATATAAMGTGEAVSTGAKGTGDAVATGAKGTGDATATGAKGTGDAAAAAAKATGEAVASIMSAMSISNIAGILLFGFAIWYFFFRKKGAPAPAPGS